MKIGDKVIDCQTSELVTITNLITKKDGTKIIYILDNSVQYQCFGIIYKERFEWEIITDPLQ
jgi:hypothetical protein